MNEFLPRTSSDHVLAYTAHGLELYQMSLLTVGQSLGVKRDLCDFKTVRAWCEAMCVGNTRYVCVDHGDVYEIARIGDSLPTAAFYSSYSLKAKKLSSNVHMVYTAVASYVAMDEARLKGYVPDVTMQAKGVIPHSYIQRKLSGYKAIKDSDDAPTMIRQLCDEACIGYPPLLVAIDPKEARDTYGSSAKLYKFNIAALTG